MLIFLLIGVAIGFLAGLLGIGGGMTMVPALTFIFSILQFPTQHLIHIAIATAMATVVFTSLSSIRAHHQRKAVLWPAVRHMSPGLLLGAAAGASVAGMMPTAGLAAFFGVFNVFAATQLVLDRKPHPARSLPATSGLLMAGGVIGFISSVVAAGGAFLAVPFMTWCNVKVHDAVGTAAALGLPIAVAATVGYVIAGWNVGGLPSHTFGFIYWPALLTIAAASVLAAPFGAATAHRWPTTRLKRVFAILLYVLAAYMLWKAISLSG